MVDTACGIGRKRFVINDKTLLLTGRPSEKQTPADCGG
jgi:hypothetical protein